ncbi:serine hydroxymethyltransferase [Thalassovita autumnalis]|uniref:Serine hydroxymethyltransferase n=1 Tax=Thalassovita autumnalis TaxID=2072972 RepID=A0A0P1FLS2_9RHOB|nr:serine hydroxymethyltransferase [Thalassovita autumnalis]CUH72038.1 serine hydroxymethyltransferase [Thalassovita autumnalis]
MTTLAKRDWVPAPCETRVQEISTAVRGTGSAALAARVEALASQNKEIHERDCFNLNPDTHVMNPRAEALLASGLGTRPSLGYPGDKYEMGLEAIEEIEVIAAALAAEVFEAQFAEIRAPLVAMSLTTAQVVPDFTGCRAIWPRSPQMATPSICPRWRHWCKR